MKQICHLSSQFQYLRQATHITRSFFKLVHHYQEEEQKGPSLAHQQFLFIFSRAIFPSVQIQLMFFPVVSVETSSNYQLLVSVTGYSTKSPHQQSPWCPHQVPHINSLPWRSGTMHTTETTGPWVDRTSGCVTAKHQQCQMC